ncbi:MAG: CpaF family protein [Anaerovoracaceae bacterium]
MNLRPNYDTVSSLKEITEAVRAVINSREEKLTDSQVLELIEEFVLYDSRSEQCSFPKKSEMVQGVFNATRKELGLLQSFADDQEVSEIMVNGPDAIFIERGGRIQRLNQHFETVEELEDIIHRLAGKVHREINDLNPILDARMEDGSRIHVVSRNVALNGPILSIRRFPKQSITMKDLLEWSTLSPEAAVFLEKLVVSGANIFLSGGTSSGKTTLLNVLTGYIPHEERIVVIEDSAELQIQGVENIVRMECRNANVQGKGEVTVRQLIRASLRMRPDRIIVGEVRGAEVMDMLQAMNTGHDGSLCTGHGNSPLGMLSRLEAMYLTAANFPADAVRGQIAEAIDIIIHMGRMPDKSRKVLEIVEVCGFQQGSYVINPLFRYQSDEGLIPTNNRMKDTIKAQLKGIAL